MAEEAKPPFWRQPHFWAAITTLGTVLGMTCPFWPAPYNAACVAGAQVVQKGASLGHQVSGGDVPSLPSAGACVEGAVQSVPAFCRCRGGQWSDYFDGGACGP